MKRYIQIIIAVVLLLVILIFSVCEIKDVPDIDPGGWYSIEEEGLMGLKLFYELLGNYYSEGDVEYRLEYDFEYLDSLNNTLLIVFDSPVNIDSTHLVQITDFLEAGNEALIVSSDIYLETHPELSPQTDYAYRDSSYILIWSDGDSMSFKHNLDEQVQHFSSSGNINYFETDSIANSESLLNASFKKSLFISTEVDSQKLYLHSEPMLFLNKSYNSTSYLTNFNKTLNHFSSAKVVLHQENYKNHYSYDSSVLKYILSQRPLKYAYYLTLLSGLLYFFFSSKRKQREIPIIEKSKNTSLDYVDTTSGLFMAQNQNAKLVRHMKRNFIYKAKSAYFLNPEDPRFVEKLAKKSKCSIDQINSIMRQLNLADTHDFNDDQLIRLYNDINSFNKNRK